MPIAVAVACIAGVAALARIGGAQCARVLAAGSVLGDHILIDSAKVGIFAASVVSAALGIALLAWVVRK